MIALAALALIAAAPDAAPPAGGRQQVFISPSGEPFRAGPDAPYPVAAWFARADADHDGAVTLTEFQADAMVFFNRLDSDHDGVVDGFESADYETKIAPEILPGMAGLRDSEARRQRSGGPGGGRGKRGRGGAPAGAPSLTSLEGAAFYSLLNEPEPVAAADADFSRRITKDEWLAAARRRFAMLDKDHDGRLTLTELPKTPMQQALEHAAEERARAAAKR